MAVEASKEKVGHIQQESTEVSAVLDELAVPSTTLHPLADRPAVNKETLRQTFAAMFKRMGIEHVKPIGAVGLQEMMLKAGIKPEDNIFSHGIIEMREE
jgi:F0F1-type ATP synthase delta subunit